MTRASSAARGETILGADNKAAVAVFMELVAPPGGTSRRRSGSSCCCTVAEEQGLRGAKAFDASALRSSCGFVLDHASADRRGDRQLADPAAAAAPTSPGSRPTPASGPRTAAARSPRPPRRSRDGARPARRGDDRERRRDRGRHLGQRRPRPLRDRRRGAQPRRRARRRGRRRDGRRLRLGRERARLRRRRAGRRAVPRLQAAAVLAGAGSAPRRVCDGPGFEPCGPRPAAAATPTR